MIQAPVFEHAGPGQLDNYQTSGKINVNWCAQSSILVLINPNQKTCIKKRVMSIGTHKQTTRYQVKQM